MHVVLLRSGAGQAHLAPGRWRRLPAAPGLRIDSGPLLAIGPDERNVLVTWRDRSGPIIAADSITRQWCDIWQRTRREITFQRRVLIECSAGSRVVLLGPQHLLTCTGSALVVIDAITHAQVTLLAAKRPSLRSVAFDLDHQRVAVHVVTNCDGHDDRPPANRVCVFDLEALLANRHAGGARATLCEIAVPNFWRTGLAFGAGDLVIYEQAILSNQGAGARWARVAIPARGRRPAIVKPSWIEEPAVAWRYVLQVQMLRSTASRGGAVEFASIVDDRVRFGRRGNSMSPHPRVLEAFFSRNGRAVVLRLDTQMPTGAPRTVVCRRGEDEAVDVPDLAEGWVEPLPRGVLQCIHGDRVYDLVEWNLAGSKPSSRRASGACDVIPITDAEIAGNGSMAVADIVREVVIIPRDPGESTVPVPASETLVQLRCLADDPAAFFGLTSEGFWEVLRGGWKRTPEIERIDGVASRDLRAEAPLGTFCRSSTSRNFRLAGTHTELVFPAIGSTQPVGSQPLSFSVARSDLGKSPSLLYSILGPASPQLDDVDVRHDPCVFVSASEIVVGVPWRGRVRAGSAGSRKPSWTDEPVLVALGTRDWLAQRAGGFLFTGTEAIRVAYSGRVLAISAQVPGLIGAVAVGSGSEIIAWTSDDRVYHLSWPGAEPSARTAANVVVESFAEPGLVRVSMVAANRCLVRTTDRLRLIELTGAAFGSAIVADFFRVAAGGLLIHGRHPDPASGHRGWFLATASRPYHLFEVAEGGVIRSVSSAADRALVDACFNVEMVRQRLETPHDQFAARIAAANAALTGRDRASRAEQTGRPSGQPRRPDPEPRG